MTKIIYSLSKVLEASAQNIFAFSEVLKAIALIIEAFCEFLGVLPKLPWGKIVFWAIIIKQMVG